MDILLDSLTQEYEQFLRLVPRLAVALLILGIAYFLGRTARRGFWLATARTRLTAADAGFFGHVIHWGIVLIGMSAALSVLGLQGVAAGLLAGGGIVAIIVGFAFKEIGENFLAGLFLSFSRPFKVGDLIQVESLQGTVQAVALRYTHIRSADGNDIYIPNARIFTQPVTNFTQDGLRRFAFRVGIDYGDDSESARTVLRDAIRTIPGVLADPPAAAHIVEMSPQFLTLEVRYWVDAFDAPLALPEILSRAISHCRTALLEAGFTMSSDVTTNVRLTGEANAG